MVAYHSHCLSRRACHLCCAAPPLAAHAARLPTPVQIVQDSGQDHLKQAAQHDGRPAWRDYDQVSATAYWCKELNEGGG